MKGLETLSPSDAFDHNGIIRMPENLQGNPQDEQRTHNLHAEKKNRNGAEENIESEQCGRRPDHCSSPDAETHFDAIKA